MIIQPSSHNIELGWAIITNNVATTTTKEFENNKKHKQVPQEQVPQEQVDEQNANKLKWANKLTRAYATNEQQ